jgi:putative endonuclease
VKARATSAEAEHALDDFRLRRVAAASEALAPRYARPGDTLRIDAIFIVPRRWPRHVPDVWRG